MPKRTSPQMNTLVTFPSPTLQVAFTGPTPAGLTTVVSASPRFRRLTENRLDDQTLASPAVSDGRIFIRGRKWLYCLR